MMNYLTDSDQNWDTADGELHWRLVDILGDLAQHHDQTFQNLHAHASAVERIVLASVKAKRNGALRRWFRERVLWRLPLFGRLPA